MCEKCNSKNHKRSATEMLSEVRRMMGRPAEVSTADIAAAEFIVSVKQRIIDAAREEDGHFLSIIPAIHRNGQAGMLLCIVGPERRQNDGSIDRDVMPIAELHPNLKEVYAPVTSEAVLMRTMQDLLTEAGGHVKPTQAEAVA